METAGGAERDRTVDLRLAKPALSQLSYSPGLVGQGRVELPTSRLSGVRSNHLSYWPGVGWDPREWETPPIHVRAVIADAVGCCRRFGPSKLSPNTFATGAAHKRTKCRDSYVACF